MSALDPKRDIRSCEHSSGKHAPGFETNIQLPIMDGYEATPISRGPLITTGSGKSGYSR
jgi:hypothetical protein